MTLGPWSDLVSAPALPPEPAVLGPWSDLVSAAPPPPPVSTRGPWSALVSAAPPLAAQPTALLTATGWVDVEIINL